jgi:hypothetical protein
VAVGSASTAIWVRARWLVDMTFTVRNPLHHRLVHNDDLRGKTTPDQVLQAQLDAIARIEGAPMEGTVPLRWLANPAWRCAGWC